MSKFFHTPTGHGVLVLLASVAAFAIAALADALHAGTLHLSPSLAVYMPLVSGLLGAALVWLRDWLEANKGT